MDAPGTEPLNLLDPKFIKGPLYRGCEVVMPREGRGVAMITNAEIAWAKHSISWRHKISGNIEILTLNPHIQYDINNIYIWKSNMKDTSQSKIAMDILHLAMDRFLVSTWGEFRSSR